MKKTDGTRHGEDQAVPGITDVTDELPELASKLSNAYMIFSYRFLE
jgi:hypothetical protein